MSKYKYVSFSVDIPAVVISLLGWGLALAQGNYLVARHTIASSSIASGGGYTASATTGQAVTSSLSGGEFVVKGGYWHTAAPDEQNRIFLPTLQR